MLLGIVVFYFLLRKNKTWNPILSNLLVGYGGGVFLILVGFLLGDRFIPGESLLDENYSVEVVIVGFVALAGITTMLYSIWKFAPRAWGAARKGEGHD